MKEKYALIVLDIQNGLVSRAACSDELIHNANTLIDAFHEKGLPVCFVRHTNTSDLAEGSPEWQLAAGLHKQEQDKVVNKSRGNAFNEQQMHGFIREQGICIVAIAGLMTQGCVQKTCCGAMRRGLGCVLIADTHSNDAKAPQTLIDKWNCKLAVRGAAVIAANAFLAELSDEQSPGCMSAEYGV